MKFLKQIGLMFLCALALALFSNTPLYAAGVVGNGTPASCDSNALMDALDGGGLVTFDCGTFSHAIASATHVITQDTTILGGDLISIDGESLRQLFIVSNGATLALQDIILSNGEFSNGGCINVQSNTTLNTQNVVFTGCHDVSSTDGGGAVYNLGTFSAYKTNFLHNRADHEGGAIYNGGIFTASHVLFEGNRAADDSGAIDNFGDGIILIEDSSFIDNRAANSGGAITNIPLVNSEVSSFTIRRTLFLANIANTSGGAINNVIGNITIENSTFVGNIAQQGGAIYGDGDTTTTVTFSTFDANRANNAADIYRPLLGSVTLGYSILTGGRDQANASDSLQCDGFSVTSLGYNIIEDGSCVDGNESTDQRNTDAKLGPLADNGGFTHTQLPDTDSPALSAIPSAQCIERDQRLALRIGNCDIGAAERGGLFTNARLPYLRK